MLIFLGSRLSLIPSFTPLCNFLRYLFFFLILFIYLAVLGLCCRVGFSLVVEARATLVVVCGLLTVVASFVAERGLRSTGPIVGVHWLSCSAACGIFLDQGWNP